MKSSKKEKPETIIRSVSFELHPNSFCSKNDKYAGRYNKTLSHKYRTRMDRLVYFIKGSLKFSDFTFIDKKKVFVKVMIFRSNFRSDPVNLSEFVNDAVKKSIKVDDRYFSEIIDWELDKEKPRVILTIEQEQEL